MNNKNFTVVDLFSGAGGMSYGFHRHPQFELIAAADAEIGKPSMGSGSLQCNSTYARNMGFSPKSINLADTDPKDLPKMLGIARRRINILSVCPPCTGFSRANPENHMRDDYRNSLVTKAAKFAVTLAPDIVVMENARELLRGNFNNHYHSFHRLLTSAGYKVRSSCHYLSQFGLPQIRERALVIAVRNHLPAFDLEDLWSGFEIIPSATTVRTAFSAISPDASERDSYPAFSNPEVAARLQAIPPDGGSWQDIIRHRKANYLLTDAMRRILSRGKLGSHPDVYGRMAWNRPAPTIKRECAHIGNGRYAHPEEHRLCSVREMAILQGFPNEFEFGSTSLSNRYRHIGDAVPPLVSHQIAWVCSWILTGVKPRLPDTFLEGTHLAASQLIPGTKQMLFHAS